MMRSKFDEQLELLNIEMIEMGALCENAIASAAKALLEKDMALSDNAIAIDREIDEKERLIENLCLRLLLQQQPVARDLRQVSSALKMITDMERIGDQAADIAEIVKREDAYGKSDSIHIADMARAAIKMVTDSIDAFVHRDLALALKVMDDDDTVDGLFNQIKGELIRLLKIEPTQSEYAVDLLMIAKYLERIGDHAVNIAEWVEYSLTGVHRNGEITYREKKT